MNTPELLTRLKSMRYDLDVTIKMMEALPQAVIEAIAERGRTEGQREDLTAYALSSLRGGEDPVVIADVISRGLVCDDGE